MMKNVHLNQQYPDTLFLDTRPADDRPGLSNLLSPIDSPGSSPCFEEEIWNLLRGEPFGMTIPDVSSSGLPMPASFKDQTRDCDAVDIQAIINSDVQMGSFDVDTFLQSLAEYDPSFSQSLAHHDPFPSPISAQETPTVTWSSPSSSSTSDQLQYMVDISPPYTDESGGSATELLSTPSPDWNLLGCPGVAELPHLTYGFTEASHSGIRPINAPSRTLISPTPISPPLCMNQPVHSAPKGRQMRMKKESHISSHRIQLDHALLQEAFTPQSRHPDHLLRALLDRILKSDFLKNHQLEPTYDSLEGYMLLVDIPKHATVPDGSVYLPFIDQSEIRCLMCGNARDCVSRALGCVRRHLGHRPYHCPGVLGDCTKCLESTAKFFTQSLLQDHIRGQTRKQTCVQCGMELRRGGMKRHWKSKHPHIDFPYDNYPTYRHLNSSACSESKDGRLCEV